MLDFSVTFIFTILNIAILFLILRVILFKPVTKFMAAREKKVQDSVEQAEKDKAQARDMLAQYETQMKNARTEAEAIIQTARENAMQTVEKIIAEGRVSAETALVNARKQIEEERQHVMDNVRKEAAALVVAATGRLLGREIEDEDNRQYADMLLDEVSLLNKAGKN